MASLTNYTTTTTSILSLSASSSVADVVAASAATETASSTIELVHPAGVATSVATTKAIAVIGSSQASSLSKKAKSVLRSTARRRCGEY